MSTNYLGLFSYLTLAELLGRAFYALLIFVPVQAACRLLGDRRPYLQLTLWSLVLIRAALPSSFSLPFSLREAIAYLSPGAADHLGFPLRCITESICPDAPPNLPAIFIDTVLPLLVLAWAGICAWLSWRFFAARRRYRAVLRAGRPPIDPRLSLALQRWRTHFRIRRQVELRIGSSGVPPFTMGIVRPCIYLPESHANPADRAAESVIAHEMAHIKRWDDAWILVCGLAAAAYFFFPPIRHAIGQLGLQRERVCDQLVASSGRISARDYAHHLLGACQDAFPCSAVAGLSARATIYSSRLAAVSEAASMGIRGIPVALLTACIAVLFVMPMRLHEPSLQVQQHRLSSAMMGLPQQRGFVLPVAGRQLGSRHGDLMLTPDMERHLHSGVDLLAPIGSQVVAMADGVVERRVLKPHGHAGGRMATFLVIRHGDYVAYYTYLENLKVRAGDTVRRGQPLATLDRTSLTVPGKPSHLHLEVLFQERSIDPMPLFASGS